MKSKVSFLAMTTLAVCTSVTYAQVTSTATATGPKGQTTTRTATHGGGDTNVTATGPNGQTVNRTVTGRGTGNVNATTTGSNGQTATRSTSRYAGGSSSTERAKCQPYRCGTRHGCCYSHALQSPWNRDKNAISLSDVLRDDCTGPCGRHHFPWQSFFQARLHERSSAQEASWSPPPFRTVPLSNCVNLDRRSFRTTEPSTSHRIASLPAKWKLYDHHKSAAFSIVCGNGSPVERHDALRNRKT